MVALLLALALALPSAPTCAATAKAAVKTTKVLVPSLGDTKIRVTPKDVDQAVCFDFTGDGRLDVAFSVFSGGTAGDIAWAFLLGKGDVGWVVAKTGSGYKLGLRRSGSALVVTQPVYRRNDPNCCPTGGFDHVAYRWQDGAFRVVRRWHTKSP